MASKQLHELLKIGLTEGESKVYLALLELGSSTVGPIVKRAGVAYSNVYEILNRLIGKGLVSYIIKGKTKYFQAVGPNNLYEYLERKEKEISGQKEALKRILPQLHKLQEQLPEQEAEIFLGKKGMKAAYDKFFSYVSVKDVYMFFYIHREEYAEETDRFYWNVLGGLPKKPVMRGIGNQYFRKSWFVEKTKRFIAIRFADFPIPGNIDIFQDKVLVISWSPEPIGFLIKSKSVADDFRTYFEAVWKTAKP